MPFADGSQEIITAEGTLARRALKNVGRLLKLPIQATDGALPESHISLSENRPEGDWQNWEGTVPFPGQIFWNEETLDFHFLLTPAEDGKQLYICIARRAIYLAVCRRTLLGNSFMLHGTLLYFDEEHASVIFGLSGMGKSTASRRFTAQGGAFLSDDKMVLTLKNGQFFAQPTPTWSRVCEEDISVPFSTALPVRSLMMLLRGEDDRIFPGNEAQWHIELASDLSEYLYVPPNWMPRTLIRRVAAKTIGNMSELKKHFGVYEVRGDLNGHLYSHLHNFVFGQDK